MKVTGQGGARKLRLLPTAVQQLKLLSTMDTTYLLLCTLERKGNRISMALERTNETIVTQNRQNLKELCHVPDWFGKQKVR